MKIDGIGKAMAKEIVDFFNEPHNQKLLTDLLALITVENATDETGKTPWKGKTFVLTGALSIARDEAKARIQELGGKVSGSVSSKTAYVVVGTDPGSKYANALKLGIPILNEEEFKKLLDEAVK